MQPLSPTTKQKAILDFMDSFYSEKKFPPTFNEIAKFIGLTKGAVQAHLKFLQKKGLVDWKTREKRSLEWKRND